MTRTAKSRQLLFVGRCNDTATQMAEAFAATLMFPVGIAAASAGLTPTHVQPWAVRIMAEVGIDISPQVAKPLLAFEPAAINTLVLVEDGIGLPSGYQAVPQVQWRLDPAAAMPRPADARLAHQRQLRDRVELLVFRLITSGVLSRPRVTH